MLQELENPMQLLIFFVALKVEVDKLDIAKLVNRNKDRLFEDSFFCGDKFDSPPSYSKKNLSNINYFMQLL